MLCPSAEMPVALASQPSAGFNWPSSCTPVLWLHRHACEPVSGPRRPTTQFPSALHEEASPRGPVGYVCHKRWPTPFTQIAACRKPKGLSCQPTTTVPSWLQPLARVLRPGTSQGKAVSAPPFVDTMAYALV